MKIENQTLTDENKEKYKEKLNAKTKIWFINNNSEL